MQIDGWRSEATAPDQLVGIRPQLVLDALLGNAGKKGLMVGTNRGADVGKDLIVGDVSILTPISLEHRAREGHELALALQQNAAPHGFHAVHRKDRRPNDFEACGAGPVCEIFLGVARLGGYRFFAGLVDAWIDRIENATHQNWPPVDVHVVLARQRHNVMEREVGPGARAVKKELKHGRVSMPVIGKHLLHDNRDAQLRREQGHAGRIGSRCRERPSLAGPFARGSEAASMEPPGATLPSKVSKIAWPSGAAPCHSAACTLDPTTAAHAPTAGKSALQRTRAALPLSVSA